MAADTTEVNYAVLDSCIVNIQGIIDDPYTSVTLGRLRSEFEYSQSDYVNLLCDTADALGEINGIVNELLFKSKYMLQMAKIIYSETDANMAEAVR